MAGPYHRKFYSVFNLFVLKMAKTMMIILPSVRVEPTNVASPPSTAMSDTLNHYTTEASPKRDGQVVYITKQGVKGVRRCSARPTHHIREFNPHRRQNIYMDYVSAAIKKTCVVARYRLREIS